MAHLEEDVLVAITVGTLPADRAAEVQAHLDECEACRIRQENISSIVFARTVPGPISKPGPTTKPDAPDALTLAIAKGQSLGRYVLLERLGAGGMGEVFAAFDPQLDRKVALKLLRSGSLSAEEGKARLLREAQAMARLQHPNVIAVHDVGTFGDRVFIAMEFVDGETLGDWQRSERTWQETLRVYMEAGSGLAAAHQAGLVHRDFKPDNVLLGNDGRPRVVDFGLARQATATPAPPGALVPTPSPANPAAGARVPSKPPSPAAPGQSARAPSGPPAKPASSATPSGPGSPEAAAPASPPAFESGLPAQLVDASLAVPLTRDGAVLGTPGYMAPEQIGGLPTDARSDQFSYCVALYEALYGKRPFGGATLRQHAKEIAEGILPAPPSGSRVPSWLWEVLKRGLKGDPEARYADMPELLAALKPRRSQRNQLLVAVTAVVAVALAGGSLVYRANQRLKACGGMDVRLAGTWDTQVRKDLGEAFAATELPYAQSVWSAVGKNLDAWSLEWVNTAREACEATKVRKEDSQELFDLKASCLEDRLEHLKALSRLLADPDKDMVRNAVAATRALEPPSTCLDAREIANRRHTEDVKEHQAEQRMAAVLIQAQALFDAGKYAQSREALKPALAPENPPRVLAEAKLLLGQLERKAHHDDAARAADTQASEAAMKSGDARQQAMAFSRLSSSAGGKADYETWAHFARAAASRVAGDWELEAELSTNEGLASLDRTEWKPALEKLTRVLELQELHLGPDSPRVAATLNNLGIILSNSGRWDEALEKYQRAYEIHLAQEGKAHPNTAFAQQNLCVVYRRRGNYTLAEQNCREALEVRRVALGPDNPETIKTMRALASVYVFKGDREAALPLLTETLEVRTRLYGADSAQVADSEDLLADFYSAGGFWKEAESWAQKSLEVARRLKGETAAVATAELRLGKVLTSQGRWADAKAHLDEAKRLRGLKGTGNEQAAVANAQGELLSAQRHYPEALAQFQAAQELRDPDATPESEADDLLGVGRCLVHLGRTPEALPPFERAVRLLANLEERTSLATAKFELARALWDTQSEERPRARVLAEESLENLPVGLKAEANAWLLHLGGDAGAGP